MRINFKPDYSKKVRAGWTFKTATVDGKTFRLIARYQDRPKRYRLEGPDVALYVTKGRSWHAGSFGPGGFNVTMECSDATLIRDKVSLTRGVAIHTAEAKAKAIIRLVLAGGS